jgi:hypothetical protein
LFHRITPPYLIVTEVQSKDISNRVEDEKGRLQVTLDVKAIISKTQEGARKTALDAK